MFVMAASVVLCIHQSLFIQYVTGMRIKTAMTAAIYRKVSSQSDSVSVLVDVEQEHVRIIQ